VASGSLVNASFSDAEAAYKEKRYVDAVQMFEGYVERKPENAWGHYMLGLSAWKAGDLDRAKGALERSLELDPRNVKVLLNLTRVLLEQGNARDALSRVSVALTLDSMSSEGYRLLGRVHSSLKQNDEAVAAYRIALALDPADVWSMNNMGLLLIQLGKYTDALGPLARAVQIDSTIPVFQNNLGIALERTGHNVLAAQAYQGALSADSTYDKASRSLTRLAGRKDNVGVAPIELPTLAEAFDRDVRSTSVASLMTKKPE
jgi:Tfp pilus assembly protein PilF